MIFSPCDPFPRVSQILRLERRPGLVSFRRVEIMFPIGFSILLVELPSELMKSHVLPIEYVAGPSSD